MKTFPPIPVRETGTLMLTPAAQAAWVAVLRLLYSKFLAEQATGANGETTGNAY
jgi:hypothetical protein